MLEKVYGGRQLSIVEKVTDPEKKAFKGLSRLRGIAEMLQRRLETREDLFQVDGYHFHSRHFWWMMERIFYTKHRIKTVT